MRAKTLTTTALAALLLAACDELPGGPAAVPDGASASHAAGAPPPQDPLERQFADIEASVPGFAGWYFDGDGGAVVRVTDPGRSGAALEAVGRILDARGQAGRGPQAARRGRPRMQARPAAYSFSELSAFRQTLRGAMPQGVLRLDLDEVNNAIHLGVQDEAAARRVRGEAARLGVPASALRVTVVPRPEPRADLSSYQRPIRGGLMHGFVHGGIFRRCAVGVNGTYAGSLGYSGYFTASHCSPQAFVGEGTTFYQPDTSHPIGTEWYEPAPVSSIVCPTGALCRRSDAMFVLYDAAVRNESGYNTIHSTKWWLDPPTEIDGYLVITGPIYSTPVGEALDKIGPTTGWTWGQVTGTCVDQPSGHSVNSKPVWVLCSTETNIYSRQGDSGSPIFKWYGDTVEWAGILWGGPGGNWNVTWHAGTYNVEYDFPGFTFWY